MSEADIPQIFRARHDEASRIASALREEGHEDIAIYLDGRADTWARAQAVLDAVNGGDPE